MTTQPTYLGLVDEEPHLVDEVWEVLSPSHCEQCYRWSVGELAWWTDPETIEGQGQIREIIRHYQEEEAHAEPIAA